MENINMIIQKLHNFWIIKNESEDASYNKGFVELIKKELK